MLSPDRLTVKSQEALTDAIGHARRNGNPLVHDTHLLVALLAQEDGIVVPILQKTWRKMSPRAQAVALGLTLTPRCRALVEQALG